MIIAVASGKGGTGKTTIAVNMALSLDNVQLLDCDVEEPNAHLFLKPKIEKIYPAFIKIPQIDESKCTYCGMCRKVCEYHAMAVIPPSDDAKGSVLVFDHLCHGCGACSILCPAGAIKEVDKEIGIIEQGRTGSIEFVHGKLNIGQIMAPPVIRQVEDRIDSAKTVIIDAPPGTSCPVIAAVKKSDYCILVTEPTPFGLNDLVLAVEVLRKMKIPFGVVINRCDIGDKAVERYCSENHIPILMTIPFDRTIAEMYSKGIPLIEAYEGYKMKFQDMYTDIRSKTGKR